MPWHCGFCSRWNRSGQRICPYCGHAARGRVCRRCREAVPGDAAFCAQCGNDNLTQPGGGNARLPRRVRLALAAAGLLVGWAAFQLATPWVVAAWNWTVHVATQVAVYAAAFWMLTALLPRPLAQQLRRVAGWLVRFLLRLVINLVH